MELNWDAIGAVGEILGAIAVLATLLYLARQIKQSTVMLRSQSRRQVLEGLTADSERLLQDNLADLVFKEAQGEELNSKEQIKVSNLALSFLGNLEIQYHEIQDGSLDLTFEETLRYRLFMFMTGPGRQRWEDNRRFFTKEFQKYVDQQLDSGLIEEFSA